MDRSTFTQQSHRTLRALDDALGEIDHDDFDLDLAGDVLTLSFADGARFVINAHGAALQIWMAAGTTAWHFDAQPDGRWIATRTNEELWATLEKVVGEKLGIKVELDRPAN